MHLSQHHLLKRLSFPPLNELGILFENQLATDTWVYFWTQFYSIGLCVCVCLSIYSSMSALQCFVDCSFVVSFEIRKCESSHFVLFQDLATQGPFQVIVYLRTGLAISEKLLWIFYRDYVECVDCFAQYWHPNNVKSSCFLTGCFPIYLGLISWSSVL